MAQLITPDGRVIEVQPLDGKRFTLAELQRIVGGYIEALYLTPGKLTGWINEDGKRLNLPVNETATLIASTYLAAHGRGFVRGDQIVGNMLITFQRETEDEEEA